LKELSGLRTATSIELQRAREAFMTHCNHAFQPSPNGVTHATLFTTCGAHDRPHTILTIHPTDTTRLLLERWIAHPDGDLLLYAPPGGGYFFDLIEPAVQRTPGVFMQRYLSVDEMCVALNHEELTALADWLLQIESDDSLLARWAADLRPQVVIWEQFRQWQADAPMPPAARAAVAESAR